MPIADFSGATQNLIGAYRDRAALNAGQKSQALGAVDDAANSVGEALARKQVEEALQKEGLDPALARDPHAAVSAIIQKKQSEQQAQQQGARDTTLHGFQQQDAETEAMRRQAEQDKARGFQIGRTEDERAYEEKQRGAEAERFTNTLGTMTAPDTSTPFNPLDPNLANFGKPSADVMTQRAQKLGANADPRAMTAAYARAPKPVAPPTDADLAETDAKRAQAERDRAAAEKDRRPEKPAKPEPYKPMTREEQIEFDADKAAATRAEPRDPNAAVDAVERLKRRMSVDDQTEFERLFNGAKQGPFGTAPTAESVGAFQSFVKAMMTKYPDAPRQSGGGGGVPAPATGGAKPPGDPAKVQALQTAGWTWDGTKWNEPAK